MFETLYKTDSPKDFSDGEYYQVHLDSVLRSGQHLFFVREKQGWFSDAQKRNVHSVDTLSPEEGLSFEEAKKIYEP